MRIPRKLKKKIPKGHYCYTYDKPIYDEDGQYKGYKIKLCPFYAWVKFKDMKNKPTWMDEEDLKEYAEDKTGYCKLIGYEIDDQCKGCGEKFDWK